MRQSSSGKRITEVIDVGFACSKGLRFAYGHTDKATAPFAARVDDICEKGARRWRA